MNEVTPTAIAVSEVSKPAHRRLHTPATAVPHYLTEFNLSSTAGSTGDAFGIARMTWDRWCAKKRPSLGFESREESLGDLTSCPEAWAACIQHREETSGCRRYWHVDVGFHRKENSHFRVRVKISHSLDFGFMGWAPQTPEASAPNFVLDWLADPQLKIRSGSLPIAAIAPAAGGVNRPRDRVRAMKVSPAEAAKLRRAIFEPSRTLPLVFISGDLNPVTFPLLPDELQRRLVGACYVVWAPPAPGWPQAWHMHFPPGFSCPTNSVRIYQPGATADRLHDSYRHRFFSEDEIRTHGGSTAFVAMIRDGLMRRLLVPMPGRIGTCEDVVSLRADQDFKKQRSELSSAAELTSFLERESLGLLEQKKISDQLLDEVDFERQRLADELASLRPYAENLAREFAALKRDQEQTVTTSDHATLLRRLFSTAHEVSDYLRVIAVLESDSVEILPSAYRSADEVKVISNMDKLRELLTTLVTTYRQALIEGNGSNEAYHLFGRNEYTSAESDNLSKKGRRARTFLYNGKEVEMEKHLKIGVKDSELHCLRVHFLWDSAAKKIVIGHCGKHLPL